MTKNKVIDMHCTDHPKYKGLRKPTAKCDSCKLIFAFYALVRAVQG